MLADIDLSLSGRIALVALWLGAIGGTAEALNRYAQVDAEVTRKIVHIGAGQVILLAWWLQIPAWVGIGAAVLFSGVAIASYRYPILPGINGVGRQSLGTFFYAISIGILLAWFWSIDRPQYAVLGILVMTWGDGLAALVGGRWGQHRYTVGGMTKSWEGSLTMAVMSLIVSLAVLGGVQGLTGWTGLVAIAIAIAATATEAFSKWGIDNLTVPISSAALSFWLNEWLIQLST